MAQWLIEFKDAGQDFLYWVVDESGVILQSMPCQSNIWTQYALTNLDSLRPGAAAAIARDGVASMVKYPVSGVRKIAAVEVAVHIFTGGYATNTVMGKRATCAFNGLKAVERLAEKLWPGIKCDFERMPCTEVGRLHGKWKLKPSIPGHCGDATREQVIQWCIAKGCNFVDPVFPAPRGWMWANGPSSLVLTPIFTMTDQGDEVTAGEVAARKPEELVQ